jgi:chromate transporter
MGTEAELGEVARLFLKLGATAFGGPAAHAAMMEDEVVRRRGWLTRQEFLDLLGATNLIPGPNSSEMAIHIGLRRAGWRGAIAGGVCFVLPAVLIVTALAWVYVRYGRLPAAEGMMGGVKPVILAVVLQALWRLGRTAMKGPGLAALAAACVALSFAGVNELAILFGAGLAAGVVRGAIRPGPPAAAAAALAPAPVAFAAAGGAAAASVPFGLWPLFAFFLKVGSVLYGSGYVLLAFLRADLVDRWHWLTEGQLLDAVAVGQFTPGPLFTTATFIGYMLGGLPGAAIATVGIFLPSFVFVAFSGPVIPRLRRSAVAGAVLDAVNAASLALMAAVTWHLGRAALCDAPSLILFAVAAVLLLRYRINSAWLVLAGALSGWMLTMVSR